MRPSTARTLSICLTVLALASSGRPELTSSARPAGPGDAARAAPDSEAAGRSGDFVRQAEIAPKSPAASGAGSRSDLGKAGADDYFLLELDAAPAWTSPAPSPAGFDAWEGPDSWKGSPAQIQTLEDKLMGMIPAQDRLAAEAEVLGASVISRYRLTANAILVRAPRTSLPALARLPSLRAIHTAALVRPDRDRNPAHLGADRAASKLGLDGAGSLVAVLDTGIDYLHADFGGPGTREAFASNDPDRIEAGSFPTRKVIGGVDLAGSFYAADCPLFPPEALRCSYRPRPDADPLDEAYPDGPTGQGHGSHVAGIIAGQGFDPAGGGRRLGPGLAPAADLMAVKIFGAPRSSDPAWQVGETALLLDGLEWVLAHNLGLDVPGRPALDAQGQRRPIDVLNISLGSPNGAGLALLEPAVRALAEAGVSVIASAGNDGIQPYIVSAPAAASAALAVAAMYGPGQSQAMVRASWGGRELTEPGIEAVEGLSRRLADGPPLEAELAWQGEACNGVSGQPNPPVQPVAGRIALIRRGDCSFVEKIRNAQSFGAVAALIYTTEGTPFAMEGACDQVGGACFDIPALMIARDPGLDLQVAAVGPESVTVRLEIAERPELENRISASSSRGPGRMDGPIKPQLAAPGVGISSAWAGTGDGRRGISGSSQAAPAVSGGAALLRQRLRQSGLNLSALDLSALLISRARPVVHEGLPESGPLVAVARQGAGLPDAAASAESPLLLRSEPGIAELGFGALHVTSSPLRETRVLSATNLSTETLELEPSARFRFEDDQRAGISLAFEPERLRLPAGATLPLTVALSVDPNGVRPWTLTGPGRARLLANPDFDRFEVDGTIDLELLDAAGDPSPDGPAGSIPFLALPRRHACVEVGPTELDLVPGGSASLRLGNDCVEPGGAAIYRLLARDASESTLPGKQDIQRIGVRHYTLPPAARDPELPNLPLQVVEFLIETREPRRTPQDSRFRIYFDRDRDGVFDRVGQVEQLPGPNFGAFVSQVDPGSLEPDWVSLPRGSSGNIRLFVADTPYDLDERFAVLRFFANHPIYGIGIDLSKGDAGFGFAVEAADSLGEAPITVDSPGFDHAPDDLELGATYAFDQRSLDCLQIECPDCPVPADGANSELSAVAPSGGSLELRVSACAQVETLWPSGRSELLAHLPGNAAGEGGQSILLRAARPRIFLPRLFQEASASAEAVLMAQPAGAIIAGRTDVYRTPARREPLRRGALLILPALRSKGNAPW